MQSVAKGFLVALIEGSIIGFLVGIGDCAVFLLFGEPVTMFDVGSALTFWTGVGAVVASSSLPMKAPLKGIFWAFLLNIPWFIYFSGQGMEEVLPMMLVMGIVFGTLIGFLVGKFVK